MLPHAHPSVCSLPVHTLSRNVPCALLQALPVPSTISAGPSPFAAALPALHSVPNCHSNPITQRVRRKRQRLPPSLLIENASNVILPLPENSSPGAFPIKASDNSSRTPSFVFATQVLGFPKMRNRRRKQAILSSPLLLVVVHQEIGAYGFCAELTQQGGHLASMVTGMVDYVDHLLPERIRVMLAFLVDVSQLFA